MGRGASRWSTRLDANPGSRALARGDVRSLDVDASAIALFGAVRSAGEFVTMATDKPSAASIAAGVIDLMIDGLSMPRTDGEQ